MTQTTAQTNKKWNASLYDDKHAYVSNYGESLLAWLDPKPHEHICDLGCGTGDLTKKISDVGAHVLGIDHAASMVQQAKIKYPKITFQIQNAHTLPFHQQFDAVFSNAVLHWVKQPEKTIASIFHTLKAGGRFVAEFGGQNNIQHIINGIYSALEQFNFCDHKKNNPWFFPSVGQYTTALEQQGFIIQEVIYYNRPTPLDENEKGLKNWVNMFATDFFHHIPQDTYQKMLTHIENKCRSHLFKDGTWFADYKRLRVRAEKPET